MEAVNREGIYDGSKPYVFISYSHKDKKSMLQVKDLLEAKGVRYWYDLGLHSGSDWYKSIAVHLKNSSACIVLLSPNSVESEYVKNELHYANTNHVPVHILMLEDFTLPEDIDMMTGRIQRINIRKEYEQKLLRSLPKNVFKENFSPPPENNFEKFKKLFSSMSKDIVKNDEINTANPLWRFLKLLVRVFRKLAKFFGAILLLYFVFLIVIMVISFFSDTTTKVVTAAEAPCFAEFAELDPCIKKAENGELLYESYILKSTNGSHEYPVVDEYIDYITSSYSFKQLGEKTFYDDIYTVWYWFEYTGEDKVTPRTGKLSDGTVMESYNLSILVHEQESGVIVRVFTAPEIKEVKSEKTY